MSVSVTVALVLVAAVAIPLLWLITQLRWSRRQLWRGAYFRRPLAERRALKEELRRRGRWVLPLLDVLTALYRPSFSTRPYRGVTGPAGGVSPRTFERAAAYRPQAEDVFVATQMKCGTTWMLQVAYEVLSRGRGDMSDSGHGALHAACPWIEASLAVPFEEAPLIGERGARLIKTHMSTLLCPYGPEARYIYVVRDPVACFASCVDFVSLLMGPIAPDRAGFLDWFCSDRMWWRSWPEHVEGWWGWAQERPNVLFVHYEEMLEDLPGVVDRVAGLLEVELAPEEKVAVCHKSGFDYMKANEELFEMGPPSFFSVAEGSFFVSGSHERKNDVSSAERARIQAFCRERLAGSAYPVERFYPELAGSAR